MKKKILKFLVVGRNHPKKNYQAIIQAANKLSSEKVKNFKIIFITNELRKRSNGTGI